VVRRIIGTKREEVIAACMFVEFHKLYSSPNIPTIRVDKSRGMKWAGLVAGIEMRNACRILIRKHEGMRSLEIYRRRLAENIKMDFIEVKV
jgi:hypothetical protein